MNFLNLSKRIFPQQWEFLAVICGINTRGSNVLQEFKERQIFIVLLNLQQVANFRSLQHWTMIISTAYYRWGAKDIVSHVTKFLGITVTRSTCDKFFKQLTLNWVWVQSFRSLLASHWNGLMVWDNFQQGQELQDQRGGRSSKFLIGRVEAVHCVVPFLNFR